RQLVDLIGIAPLLVVSAGLLGIALGCVVALGRWARLHSMRRHVIGHEDAVGGGMFDGLKQIFADRFMRNMALLMLLGDAIGTIAYASVADYSGATFHDAVARTRFAANVDLATNIFQICVQVTLTRWLLKRSGAGPVIAVWAVVGVVVCLAMAVSGDPYAPALPLLAQHVSAWSAVIRPNGVAAFLLRLPVELLPVLSWVVLMLVVTRGLVYAMVQPARESLYTRVPRDLRYKGKNAVDTAVWRAGDVMSSLSINGLRALGMSIAGFGLIGAAALTASGVIGWRLAKWIEREPASDARASDAHASAP
ncbi:MAG: hypothetical protein ABJA62_08580, partial [Luteimonas sp.]